MSSVASGGTRASVAELALRLTSVTFGLAGSIFGGLALIELLGEVAQADLVVSLISLGLLVALPLALAVASFWASVTSLRFIAGTFAAVYLLALFVSAIWPTPHVQPHGDVWLLSLTALPAAAAMMARPRTSSWLYLVVMSVLVVLVATRASQSSNALSESVLLALYDYAFGGFFVGCVYVTMRSTAELDKRRRQTELAEVAAEANHAREQERTRFEAIVHDGVISTLLVAGRGGVPAERLAAHAQDTLSQLAFRADPRPRTASDLSTELRLVAQHIRPELSWMERNWASAEIAIPAEIAQAFTGALAEAVRNTLLHAMAPNHLGDPVRVTVELRLVDSMVQLEIRDDGVGFELDAVAPERLGISRSILGRMGDAGGHAHIVTRPGGGTAVTLEWEAL